MGTRVKVLAQLTVKEDRDGLLVLQSKRVFALGAAAVTGAFGLLIAIVGIPEYYPTASRDDLYSLLFVGGFSGVLVGLSAMFLYFGLRRPDRIVFDGARREVRVERRKKPLTVAFDDVAEVALRTEKRRVGRDWPIVHPVVLVTRDGGSVEVDAASDERSMIVLAARVRKALALPLNQEPPAARSPSQT